MKKNGTFLVAMTFVAATAVALLWTQRANAGVAQDPQSAGAPVVRQSKANSDTWHFGVVDGCFHSVWVGPRLEDAAAGPFRFVNLTFHDFSVADCSGVWAAIVRPDGREPIAVDSGAVKIAVLPAVGLTWGEVDERTDLAVDLRRY
ncbi:MAG: hypothetical protein NXI31_00585 [bacterium]|nr:hypothetical protein [bacterium]